MIRMRRPTHTAVLAAVLVLAFMTTGTGIAAPSAIGEPAPDFAIRTLDGTPFQLSGQQGRITILMFTGSGEQWNSQPT